MSNVAIIVVLAGVAAVGLLRIAMQRVAWTRTRRLAEAYLSRFRHVARSELFDEDGYAWLVAQSDKMQERLGPLGLNEPFSPTPYDYDAAPLPADPLLLNTLPDLRSRRARPERLARCEDALLRYLGKLDDERPGYVKRFANPVVWVGEGVRGVLLLPFLTLQWVGLLKENAVDRLAHSALFSLLSGLIAVLGLAAAAMIAALGWEHFTALTRQWIGVVLS